MTSLMLTALFYSLDRLMNYQDRVLYSMQYFHRSKGAARLNSELWLCYGTFILTAAEPNPIIQLGLLLFKT